MKTVMMQASAGNEWVYLVLIGIGLLFLVALIGALKPLFRRFTGHNESISQQRELIDLQRQQLEQMRASKKAGE